MLKQMTAAAEAKHVYVQRQQQCRPLLLRGQSRDRSAAVAPSAMCQSREKVTQPPRLATTTMPPLLRVRAQPHSSARRG